MPDRDELADLYRRCAEARQRLQDQALQGLPREQVLKAARALNLPLDAEMAQIGEADLTYAFDLALYTAPVGRPAAMARFAVSHLRRQRELLRAHVNRAGTRARPRGGEIDAERWTTVRPAPIRPKGGGGGGGGKWNSQKRDLRGSGRRFSDIFRCD